MREEDDVSRFSWLWWFVLMGFLPLLLGCNKVPQGRSSVDDVTVRGAKKVDSDDITDKIATTESPKFLGLFRGVLYEYSVYDRNLLQRDLARVEAIYRSKGYYDAHARAGRVFQIDDKHVRVEIVVEEGEPVLVRGIKINGLESIPENIQDIAHKAATDTLKIGQPFDQEQFDNALGAARRALTDRGYAYAKIKNDATVDIVEHRADVIMTATPGEPCKFGEVTIEGLGSLPEKPVRRAIDITPGEPYSEAEIDSAQQAVLDLGVFASVDIQPDLPDPPRADHIVAVKVKLEPSRLRTVRLGGGLEFDALKADVHAIVGWEHRNFFGGLRTFRVDDKPGVVLYPLRFNNIVLPNQFLPENRLRVEFRQPGFIEARTNAFIRPEFNIQALLLNPNPPPDARVIGYAEARNGIGLDRSYWRLFGAISHNIQVAYPFAYVGSKDPTLSLLVISYPELITSIDFRNDRVHPRKGIYLLNTLQVAGGPFGGQAKDVKVQPDLRGYVPLTKRVVLALRGSTGFLFPQNYGDVVKSRGSVYEASEERTNDYQLTFFRGFFSGGPTSNRGYPLRGVGPHDVVPFISPDIEVQRLSVACGGDFDCHGRVHLTSETDLAKVIALFPPGALPIAELRGALSVQARIGRDAEDAPPEIMLHAHTNGLAAAARSGAPQKVDGVVVEQPPPWRSTDLDFGLDVRNDGTSGFTNVAFRATDRHGAVVALDAKATLPYEEMTENPSLVRDRVMHAPIAVKIVAPVRRLDQLPGVLAVRDLQGAAEATIDVEGTAADPRLHAVARGRSIRSAAMPQDVKADADLALDYDGNEANLAVKMRSQDKELVDLVAHVEARVHDLLEPVEGATPFDWNASAGARLAGFPLETIPQLTDRRVKGRVSGEVKMDGLRKDAVVKGKIDIADLQVGRAKYPTGAITIDTSGGKLAAKVRLDQPPGKDAGFVEATVGAGLHWGADLVPKLDAQQPLEAKLVAKSFRAAAIQPFVENQVPVLDGQIEANASAKITPGKLGAELQGAIQFHDGTVQLASLGEELRGVKANIGLAPDGSIKVTDVAAKGTQGAVYADAEAKLDGMRLEHATANIRIPEKEALDLALQGQPVGDISGNIAIKASQSADAKSTAIVVDVPKLKIELPKVTKGGLQTLEEKENVHIGVYRGRPELRRFVKLPLDKEDLDPQEKKDGSAPADASRLDVDVKLGRIEVEKGNQARIVLSGNPKVRIVGNSNTQVFGQIRAESGWADVQGKKFEVEKGTITFNGEADNPVVVATARWAAQDGSEIYADFVGPVKTGKVTLRSEPARPRNEILALILFGTADGANPTPPPPGKQPDGTTKAAVGLGGGFAAEGLTEALDDLAGIKATARIDSTRANNPRPELEFQLSTKVSIAFAHVIGTPPITEPDRNLATVEYRFHKNWSLETTVGDRGTALLDALWQKRY